jgi:secondary thiamine-phosphate synthase enzyme
VLVYVPHTTAGVTINEHADPMVARDFEAALERIVPADWPWQHVEEGEENAPTHIRASFMGPSVLVPLRDDGTLALGTWQGIFFCEFDGPRTRSLHVSVLAYRAATWTWAKVPVDKKRCQTPFSVKRRPVPTPYQLIHLRRS